MGTALADPTPHFGLTVFAGDERHVARIIVRDEEVAAILDGVTLSEPRATIPLLRLVIAEVSAQANDHLTAGDLWEDGMDCASELEVLTARLPLAALIHKYLMVERETDWQLSHAEREGWNAQIRELFVGTIPGFKISGKERDALVGEVRDMLKVLKGSKQKRRELKAILRDTGKKRKTGEGCTLTSLPMPELVEWLRLLGPDITAGGFYHLPKEQQKKLKRRHGLIRDMWIRVRREIEAGPQGVG